MVEIHSFGLYEEILRFATESMMVGSYGLEAETMVNTMYKIMAKKVKLVATQLLPDSEDHIKKAKEKPRLRGDKIDWIQVCKRNIGQTEDWRR